jgi:hypothetical protein
MIPPHFRRGDNAVATELPTAAQLRPTTHYKCPGFRELPQNGLGQGGKSRVKRRGLRMGLRDTEGVAVSVPAVHQRRGHLGLRGV